MCLPAKYLLKKPLVISAYGADIYLAERYKIKKWVEWILNRSDAIVVNSEATENAVKTVGARKKSQIIYWGVDTERYNPKTRDKTKIKRTKSRYGIQGGKIILFAGRLIERKGVEYLVRAIPEIRKNIKDFNLVIVGGGPLEKELKKLAKELGITSYVVFTGRISDEELLQFYHMCDVFVLPAIVDSKGDTEGGQGLVTKEAMACEKPVVVSGVGGIPDLIQHGKTGILVKEKNPQELAEAITTILNDKTLADRISKSGRKLIEREASWDVTCRGYFRLYEKLSAF
jgi:glycosyltransferase involved in cell wall biosynthesis